MVNNMHCENQFSKGKKIPWKQNQMDDDETSSEWQRTPESKDDWRRTLSGEQDLLSIARQPEPRWSLSVGKHLYPVHELLTPVENQNCEKHQHQSSSKNCFFYINKLRNGVILKTRRLLTECRQASWCPCVRQLWEPVWTHCRSCPWWKCGPGRWWADVGQTHCQCGHRRWTEPSKFSEPPRGSCLVQCSDGPVCRSKV